MAQQSMRFFVNAFRVQRRQLHLCSSHIRSPFWACHNAGFQQKLDQRLSVCNGRRLMSSQTAEAAARSNTNQTDQASSGGQYEFQADTRMLLEIVAKSLYSDHEVFIRELISNASDALEKFRYKVNSDAQTKYQDVDRPLNITIETNQQEMTIIFQDTGIGMTKDELFNNLGTIARSGSKQFLQELKSGNASAENTSNIIGQFGVGFYSSFMVANRVDVYTKSAEEGSIGYHWSSDGASNYAIKEADDVALGTKIIVHLKPEYRQFSNENTVKEIIKKYCNFVERDIIVNGEKYNNFQALWLLDPKDVTKEQHEKFYRFIANTYDEPRFTMHYKADVPLSIRALFYIPKQSANVMEMSPASSSSVALYTRKILISSKTDQLLPKYLRFVKGVVDSEDIPLNLSREMLQNSALITKIRNVLTNRVLRYLQECARKQPAEYDEFYNDYSIFLKEGIIVAPETGEKQELAKLLRFDSSRNDSKQIIVSLPEYVNRMPADQKDVYYIAAPSRALAENSPYYEGLKTKNYEVLFCYDPYDELVLMQLQSFNGKNIVSVEKEMRQDNASDDLSNLGTDSLLASQITATVDYIKNTLIGKVANVKATTRLVDHPCVITVEEMAAARHFIRTNGQKIPEAERLALLQPQLEINPKHPIIKSLHSLHTSNPDLAVLLTNQLFAHAMVEASLTDDPRSLLRSMNELLIKLLEKH